MTFHFKKLNPAFTLIEIIVVIVIVGVMSAIALPKMGAAIERFRAKEGEQVLIALYGAEQRYAVDKFNKTCSDSSCQFWTPNLTLLDVDNTRTPPNFNSPSWVGGSSPIRIDRMNGAALLYTLTINYTGSITCSNNATLCAKMKYN